MMTEDEAKTKWCPFARVWDGAPPGAAAVNRKNSTPRSKPDADCLCIASGCAAWRWAKDYHMVATEFQDGHCGLAGSPE